MATFFLVISFLLISHYFSALASESPFANYLSPTTIYLSYFNASKSIEILTYPTTKAFHSYYHSILLNFPTPIGGYHYTCTQTEESIINSTLKPALAAFEAQLGISPFPPITAFFISYMFPWSFRFMVTDAIFAPIDFTR